MKKIFAVLLLASSVSANAQSTKDTLTLKEIQVIGVSATQKEPITQTKIDCYELSYLNNNNDPFFILGQATPSIYAQSDNGQENGYSYMRLRGLDQSRINFNLNGIQLNEMEDQGLYFSNMPGFYNYIGSINVERGVGTSKYGNTSEAGSVDMETRGMTEKTLEGNVLLKNSTNDNNINVFYSSGIQKNGLAVQLGGSYLNNNGFKDHSGNDGASAYYSLGLFKKKNIFKFYGISGIAHNQLAFYGVPMPMIDSYYKTNLNLASDKDTFKQNLMCFNWVNYGNSKIKFNTSVYFDNVNGTYSTADILFGVKSYQYGAMSNMVIDGKNMTTNIGVNGNVYTRNHFGSDNNGYYDYPQNCQPYTNVGHKEDVIVYIKGLNTHKQYDLFYDVQARSVWFQANPSKLYNWNFINPKVGIKTHTGINNLYANFGITHREPTRTDMIQSIVQSDSTYHYGNTDNTKFLKNDTINLKPETVYDYEMGDNFHMNNLDINLNFYSIMIKNEYVATGVIDPYSGFMVKRAVSSTMRTGIEANIKVKLNHFNLFFNFNAQHSGLSYNANDYTGKIPFAPNFIGSVGGSYTYKFLTVGAVEQTVSEMLMSLDQNYTSDAYSVVNTFATAKWNIFTLTLKANNIFDNKYYIPAGVFGTPTYYVGQLANYSLTLKVKI